jgi:membrane peptidoglycan carboxypeptidase
MSTATHEIKTLDVRKPLAVVGIVVVALLAATAGAIYGDLPGVGDARARIAAELTSHRGQMVAVRPRERIARALVAVEDERFFQHGAVDPIAIARVITSSIVGSAVDPGGSTIAQQLAKVLYDEPDNLSGRLRAIGLAFKLEARYSKPAILSMYLNAVYFGHDFYGIDAASRGYFGRSPSRLTWAQASLLAGLPQAPSAFDPLRHLAAARARQREVLARLVARKAVTQAGANRIYAQPLDLR